MRPLKLSMEAIRSYRYRTELDFTDRSLIAIIGPTGAGKSTILEAITFALYNKPTFRGQGATSKSLIANHPSVRTMSVTLEFLADGRKWRVLRQTSKGSSGNLTHLLQCLSDSSVEDVTGATPVTKSIEELLGLSYDAYLSSVILPQGRFQSLLTGSAEERTGALKGIFRLEAIEEAHGRADKLRDEARENLEESKDERRNYIEDPSFAAAHAHDSSASLRKSADALVVAREEAQEYLVAADDLETSQQHLSESWRLVDPVSGHLTKPQVFSERLQEAYGTALSMESELAEIQQERRAYEDKAQEAKQALLTATGMNEASDDENSNQETPTISPQTVNEIEDALDVAREEVERHTQRCADLLGLATSITDRERRLETLNNQLEEARHRHADLEQRRTAAERALDELSGALSEADDARSQRDIASANLTRRVEEREVASARQAQTEAELHSATERLEDLRAELSGLKSAESVVLLRSELHAAGAEATCPVCLQDVPEIVRQSFEITEEAPEAALDDAGRLNELARAIKEAEERRTAATAAAGRAAEASNSVLTAEQQASTEFEEAEESLRERCAQLEIALGKVRESFETISPVEKGSVNACDFGELITSAHDTLSNLYPSLKALRDEEVNARSHIGTLEGRFADTQDEIGEKQSQKANVFSGVGPGLNRLRELLGSEGPLGHVASASLSTVLDEEMPDGTQALEELKGNLELLREDLEARQKFVREARRASEGARDDLARTRDAEREIASRLESGALSELSSLSQEVVRALESMRSGLEEGQANVRFCWDLIVASGASEPADPDLQSIASHASEINAPELDRTNISRSSLSKFANGMEEVLTAFAVLKDTASTGFENADSIFAVSIDRYREKATSRLRHGLRQRAPLGFLEEEQASWSPELVSTAEGTASLEDLFGQELIAQTDREITLAESYASNYDKEAQRYEAQVEPARVLDARIAGLEHKRDLYEDLRRLLATGKFLKYAREVRQQELLAVASEIFQSMTDGKYGFDGDFHIVERESSTEDEQGNPSVPVGEPRDPKTLSGGETFLGSLSLALGMMELAGRHGGRLEGFFLDEGFGTLDPEALELALVELSERARSTGRMIGVISHVPEVAEHVRASISPVREEHPAFSGSVLEIRRGEDGSSEAIFESTDTVLHTL